MRVAVPSQRELQVIFVEVSVVVSAAGSVMVTLAVAVQPFASVTVSEYVPGPNPTIVGSGAPVLHAYVYKVVPPETVAVAVPFAAPLQVMFVEETVTVSRVGSEIGMAIVSSQPFASAITTE